MWQSRWHIRVYWNLFIRDNSLTIRSAAKSYFTCGRIILSLYGRFYEPEKTWCDARALTRKRACHLPVTVEIGGLMWVGRGRCWGFNQYCRYRRAQGHTLRRLPVSKLLCSNILWTVGPALFPHCLPKFASCNVRRSGRNNTIAIGGINSFGKLWTAAIDF